jgi:hypothetical protein
MEIKLPENYVIELEVTQTSCFGRIYHPGILHQRNKTGYFLASIVEENETFVESIVVDVSAIRFARGGKRRVWGAAGRLYLPPAPQAPTMSS